MQEPCHEALQQESGVEPKAAARILQKFAALHGSIHNHVKLERTLISGQPFKERRTAALNARRQPGAASSISG